MVRAGRGNNGGMMARGTGALGLAALAATARSAAATGCAPLDLVNYNMTDYIRYSGTSNMMYLQNGACVTMEDIYNARMDSYTNETKGPVYPFDEETKQITTDVTGSWYLDSSLFVTEGSKLVVQGSAKGGDCDHLLLASNPDVFIQIRAHGGEIMLDGTHVESWDMDAGGVDEDYEDGRSYLSAISEVITNTEETCDGMAKNDMGESRLDIIDSEINHLGYYESESYGIAYKVRGFCKDLSNPEIFDTVSVTGDILRSHIHHLYFGHYSYGHQGGNWSYNVVHDNIGYGFDPHDDSDYVTIHNNHVYNNGWHGIIASKRCDHVSIQNNYVHDNGHITEDGKRTGNGIMLHRSCDHSTIKNNTVHDNMDSGVALYESSFCEVSRNDLYKNKNGIRMSMGSSDNVATENKIVIHGEDEKYGIYLYMGNDKPDVADSDGRPRRNHVHGNSIVSDNAVVMMRNVDDNTIEGNTIVGLQSRFVDAINTLWIDNDAPDAHEFVVEEDDTCFDPASNMDAAENDDGYSYGFEYSYSFPEGFFCGE